MFFCCHLWEPFVKLINFNNKIDMSFNSYDIPLNVDMFLFNIKNSKNNKLFKNSETNNYVLNIIKF